MKILIVDDSATIRNILKTILEESGHIIDEAMGGEVAIDIYLNKKPDLILMDVEMEGLSGYDTAKKIRALNKNDNNQKQEDWIPIVFLSAHSDEKSLSEGIESGGDDYLFKPFSKVVLNAKIKAMERICEMRKAIILQKDLVDKLNADLIEEQTVAKNIYDNIVQNGVVTKHDFINTYVSSKAVFNGDLALTARSSSDNYYIIIGDFTGHGLSAALGIIPAAELFLKLTLKGFTLEQLLIELNFKLHNILPANIFCAAAVLEVDLNNGLLSVWNGWSPEVLCFSKNGQLKKSFGSTNMPLGSLKKDKFNCKLTLLELEVGDKIYIYSDGFTEAKNIAGNMFGIDGVKSSIIKGLQGNLNVIDAIVKDVTDFRGNYPQQDDLTLIEITMSNNKVNN